MKTNMKILVTSLIILFISCTSNTKQIKVHKLKNGTGYCYQNNNDMLLWYILIYNNSTGTYDVQQTSVAPDCSPTVETFSASENTVTNFDQTDMTETTGEDTGGSNVESNDSSSDSSGMSESSGSDGGGSDGGGE